MEGAMGPGGWLKDDMSLVKSMDLLTDFLVNMNIVTMVVVEWA